MNQINQELIEDFVERGRRAQEAVDRAIAESMANHPAGRNLCPGKHCGYHHPLMFTEEVKA